MMSINSKKIMSGLFVALAIGISSPAYASGGGKWHEKMATELKLTPEQKEKMKAVHQSDGDTIKEKRKAMKAARESLETNLQGTATEDDLRKQFAELEKAQSDFAKTRFEKVLSMRAILTPEQRQKFKGLRKEHRGFRDQGSDSDSDDE